MPYSKFKKNIAEILKREGYIADYTAKEARVGQTLEVTLKYGPQRRYLPTGLRNAWQLAAVRLLTKADAAQTELAVPPVRRSG